MAGVSRSSAFVIGYLIVSRQISLEKVQHPQTIGIRYSEGATPICQAERRFCEATEDTRDPDKEVRADPPEHKEPNEGSLRLMNFEGKLSGMFVWFHAKLSKWASSWVRNNNSLQKLIGCSRYLPKTLTSPFHKLYPLLVLCRHWTCCSVGLWVACRLPSAVPTTHGLSIVTTVILTANTSSQTACKIPFRRSNSWRHSFGTNCCSLV